MLMCNSEVRVHFFFNQGPFYKNKTEECHLLSLKLNSPFCPLLSAAEAEAGSHWTTALLCLLIPCLALPAGGATMDCQTRAGSRDFLFFICFLWASFQHSLQGI